MKKFVLTFVAMFMAVMAMAQSPSVTISYDSIATDQITVSYAKNADCTNYYIFSGNIGEAEGWVPMMGSLENVIKSWGINCTNDTTKVWDMLTPNTMRVHYVIAVSGATEVLITDTVSTAALGGEGLSTMTIAISEVTDSSAHVVVTPNDQTSEFHTMLVTKSLYLEWGEDSVVNYMKQDPYPQYDVDDHVWPGLISGTEYKVMAIGKNVNNEWGEVAIDSFATTGERPMPAVEVTIDSVGTMGMKTSYAKNVVCSNYYIFMGMVGELDQWLPMMGSLEAVVKAWGINCTNDTTKVWDEMTPNTDYVFYTLAVDGTVEVMTTDTVKTMVLGGEGLSQIEISVEVLSDTSARVINTPNDQTAMYKSFVIEKASADENGLDSVMAWLKEDPYTQYDVYDWTWASLKKNTEYYAVALGQNANGEWGELAQVAFSTGDVNGIDDIVETKVTVYPNPTTSFVKVSNVSEGSIVTMYDLQGRAMMQTKANGNEITLDMSTLTAGMYIMQVSHDGVVERGVRIIKK